jgi:hypothetical protein
MTAFRAGAWRGRGAIAAAVWLSAVAAIAVLRSADGWPRSSVLASSPSDVATGRLWSLITSGLVVTRPAGVQIAAAAVLVPAVVALLGGAGFWWAALAGHVGSALIAYAGLGVLWLVARADVDSTVGDPDYGISCINAAAAGALVAVVLRERPRRLRIALIAAVTAALAVVPPFGLASVEHGLAFGLGAAVTARITLRHRTPA